MADRLKLEEQYNYWNEKKKYLAKKRKILYFHEREVWFTSIGYNLGDEEFGKNKSFSRPVLVLKKFNLSIFWGIPLSTRIKKNKYYYNFSFIKGVKSSALLTQLRLFDQKRLIKKIGVIEIEDFEKIKKSVSKLLNG